MNKETQVKVIRIAAIFFGIINTYTTALGSVYLLGYLFSWVAAIIVNLLLVFIFFKVTELIKSKERLAGLIVMYILLASYNVTFEALFFYENFMGGGSFNDFFNAIDIGDQAAFISLILSLVSNSYLLFMVFILSDSSLPFIFKDFGDVDKRVVSG